MTADLNARSASVLNWVVAAFAVFLTGYATLYQCFSERQVYFDEVGLFNPVYMYLNFGKMTYPAHEQFDTMFIHPPVYYWLVALVMRTGLSVYHAAGLITVLIFVVFAILVVWSRFSFPVKIALLFGCFLGAFVWNEALVLRPDLALALSWIAGLAALESARLNNWSAWRLTIGGFLLAFATGVHYPGVASIGGLLVYAVWVWSTRPREQAWKSIGWMGAGASLFLIPYALLFLLPHLREILSFSLTLQRDAAEGSPFARHMQAYAGWRNALSYWMTFRPVTTTLTEPLFRWSIPAAFLAPVLLLLLPGTRGMALACLPHLLFLLLVARHKQIGYTGYFAAEVMIYLIAITAVLLTALLWIVQRLNRPWVTGLAGVVIVVGMAFAARNDPPALAGPRVVPVRGIYDFEVGHAAGRAMLGPDAVVGTSSAGVWYTAGATHLEFVTPELLYPADISCLDRKGYFGLFDALAVDPQQSWASWNKQHISITSSYLDGTLQLRGFFFADRRFYYESALSYMLYSVNRPSRLTGYGVRNDTVYRFDEAPEGDQVLVSAVCPVNASTRELSNYALKLDFFAELYRPLPDNIDPREGSDLSVPAAIVSFITDRGRFENDLKSRLKRCTVRDQVLGRFTELNLQQFVADSEKTDQPMHFYRSFDDFRKNVGRLRGHEGLATMASPPNSCVAK